MKLCNMLSERYAKLLLKTQNGSLNMSDYRQLSQGSIEEGYKKNCSNISDRNQRTGFREKPWDDFDDKNVRKTLDEILHHRMTKLDATKRDGSTCEAGLEHNTNSEEYVITEPLHLEFLHTLTSCQMCVVTYLYAFFLFFS